MVSLCAYSADCLMTKPLLQPYKTPLLYQSVMLKANHFVSGMCSRSDLVHLVHSHSQLSDAQRTHQQGMLSGLTARLEACLKLSSAGIHHEHGHIGLETEK